jgi:hypothetical protein
MGSSFKEDVPSGFSRKSQNQLIAFLLENHFKITSLKKILKEIVLPVLTKYLLCASHCVRQFKHAVSLHFPKYSINGPGVMIHGCNTSYWGDRCRRIVV